MREQPTEHLPGNEPKNRVRKYDFINPLIGHRIRMLRQEKDISRSRVAKHINKTSKQLAAIESGNDDLTAQEIYKLCSFFAVEASYFFIDLAEMNHGNGELAINAHQAKELGRLFDSYLNLPNRDMQKSLVQLAESVAQADM